MLSISQRKPARPGASLGKTTGWAHRAALQARGVDMRGGIAYRRIDDQGLHITGPTGNEVLDVDSVIVCAGQESCTDLLTHLPSNNSCTGNWWSIACGGAGRGTRHPRGHGARSTAVAIRMDYRLTMFDELSAQLPLWSERDALDGWAFRESRRARRLTVRVFHSGRVEIGRAVARIALGGRALSRAPSTLDREKAGRGEERCRSARAVSAASYIEHGRRR